MRADTSGTSCRSVEQPWTVSQRAAVAVVWAVDGDRVGEAIEHLHHGLWPGRHAYEITSVQTLRLGVPCPLRRDDPRALDNEVREGWMWILVMPEVAAAWS